MKSLNTYINEKLIINKDYNYNYVSLDEIYDLNWKYYDRLGEIQCVDKDRKAFDMFYEYFVHNAKQKITFHQQCRFANNGEYLFAVNESEKKIYLFHRHMDLSVHQPPLYEKFEILPTSNGMRINFMQMMMKQTIYPLSTKSMFTIRGTNPQYYLIDEELWKEMKTLYNDLKNR